LKWSQKQLSSLGNKLADFSFSALKAQVEIKGWFVKEQPEDLGALRTGPWPGKRPASMWQFPQHADLLSHSGVRSIAIFQSDFGAQYPKPTRLLTNLPVLSPGIFHEGLPKFDENGFYQGPLPKCTSASTNLKRSSKHSPFATSGTAAWPPGLCSWLALSAVTSFEQLQSTALQDGLDIAPGITAVETLDVNHSAVHEKHCLSVNPTVHPLQELGRDSVQGGFGLARVCNSPGKVHGFHDGATLLSPGRWDKQHRNIPMKPAWCLLRGLLNDLIGKDLNDA
jgi:hypothetical protein